MNWGYLDAKRFRYVMVVVSLLVAAITYYSVAFLPSLRAQLHVRNERALSAIARNMESLLGNVPYLARTSIAPGCGASDQPCAGKFPDYRAARCAPERVLSEDRSGAFEATYVGHSLPCTTEHAFFKTRVVQEASSPNIRLRLCNQHEPKVDNSCDSALDVSVDLRRLLAPGPSEIFDSIVVTSGDTFMLQTPAGGALTLSADDLRSSLRPVARGDKIGERPPTAGTLAIGPARYWVYGRPLITDPGLQLQVFALVRDDTFEAQLEGLSWGTILVVLALVALLVLALPYLKVTLIGDREPLRRWDIYALLWSGLAFATLLTLVLCDLGFLQALRGEVDLRLGEIGGRLHDRVANELDDAVRQLQRIEQTCRVRPPRLAEARANFWSAEATCDDGATAAGQLSPGFVLAGVDAKGFQVGKLVPHAEPKSPLTWLGDREYFVRTVRQGETNVRDGDYEGFDFDVVRSRTSGEVVVLIGTALKCREGEKGPCTNLGGYGMLQLAIKNAQRRFLGADAGMRAAQKSGLEAAVVDQRGRVMMRSRPQWSDGEDLLSETDPGSGLAHVLERGNAVTLHTRYQGIPHTVVVRPLANTPWRVVLLADERLISVINTDIVTRTLLLSGMLLGIFALFSFAYLQWCGHEWMWPRPGYSTWYAWLCVGLPIVAALLLWLVFDRALSEGSMLAILALFQALMFALPVGAARAAKLARRDIEGPSSGPPSWYRRCAGTLLLSVTVVPTLTLFAHSSADVRGAWECMNDEKKCHSTQPGGLRPDVTSDTHDDFQAMLSILPRSAPFVAALQASAGRKESSAPSFRPFVRDFGYAFGAKDEREPAQASSAAWSVPQSSLFSALFILSIGCVWLLIRVPAERVFGLHKLRRNDAALCREPFGTGPTRVLHVGSDLPQPLGPHECEIYEALYPDIDLTALAPRLPNARRLVLTEVHTVLSDPRARSSLLAFLREAVRQPDLSIHLFSQVEPPAALQSYERAVARETQRNSRAPGKSDPVLTAMTSIAPRPDARDWSRLLASFTWERDAEATEAQLGKLLEGVSSHLSKSLQHTLIRECGWHARLHRWAMMVTRHPDQGHLSEQQIVDLVAQNAAIDHGLILAAYPTEQKLVLSNVANESFVNPTLWDDALELEAQGVLVRDPALRIRAESFARFVRRDSASDDVARLEQAEPSRWAGVRNAAGVSAFVGLLVLFWWAPAIGGAVLAALTPAISGLTGLSKVFGGNKLT